MEQNVFFQSYVMVCACSLIRIGKLYVMVNVLVYKKWPWLVSQSGFKSIENNNCS